MDSLSHQQLMNKQGQGYTAESVLANVDVICYYFSAHWCPPCRMFTPILADFYRVSYDNWSKCKLHKIMSHYDLKNKQDVKGAGGNIEVVFVSSDRSQQEMFQYMAESHAEWMAIPWGSPTAA